MFILLLYSFFFFFNDTATTEIYTLSLHDALPIWVRRPRSHGQPERHPGRGGRERGRPEPHPPGPARSGDTRRVPRHALRGRGGEALPAGRPAEGHAECGGA